MFIGKAKHTIDAKNRIRIPSMFKTELGSGFALVLGHGCINIFPKSKMESILKSLAESVDIFDKEQSKKYRQYMSMIDFPNEDNQGRFVIDGDFIKKVGLGKEISIIGMGDHLEVVPYEEMNIDEEEFDGIMAFMSQMTRKHKDEI